jgi:hypothetical protein
VTGLKKNVGLTDDASDSGLNPLTNIHSTGKKKMSTRTHVTRVVRAPLTDLVELFIGFLLP